MTEFKRIPRMPRGILSFFMNAVIPHANPTHCKKHHGPTNVHVNAIQYGGGVKLVAIEKQPLFVCAKRYMPRM